MILDCTCKHEFQDARYGHGKRVHNHAPKAFGGAGGYRCTVCLALKQGKAEQPKEAKK